MAVLAILIIAFQLWQDRPNVDEITRYKILLPDICIIIISGILIINLPFQLINEKSFQLIYTYGKVSSAILLYILGRLCFKRIEECPFFILSSSYIVVYANLICRIIRFKGEIFNCYNPDGDLYYYDTDMAFSIIMALIFIAILGQNTLIKFITIFAVCPFMVFHSNAGTQKILLVIILIILVFYMGERAVKKHKFTDFIMPSAILFLMLILAIILLPVFTDVKETMLFDFFDKYLISTANLSNKFETWRAIWLQTDFSNIKGLLIGNGIPTSTQIDNTYLATIYSIGFIGLISAIIFVLSISGFATKIKDRQTYYITIMLTILFLGSCINKNGLEFTQMSWFVMMYFGMATSSSTEDIIISTKKKIN